MRFCPGFSKLVKLHHMGILFMGIRNEDERQHFKTSGDISAKHYLCVLEVLFYQLATIIGHSDATAHAF